MPAAVEFFGIIFFLVFFQKIVDGRPWPLLAGFALPIVISLVYFSTVGVGEIYVRSALLQNIAYLSSWGGGKASVLSGGLMTRALTLGLLLLLVWLNRKNLILVSDWLWSGQRRHYSELCCRDDLIRITYWR